MDCVSWNGIQQTRRFTSNATSHRPFAHEHAHTEGCTLTPSRTTTAWVLLSLLFARVQANLTRDRGTGVSFQSCHDLRRSCVRCRPHSRRESKYTPGHEFQRGSALHSREQIIDWLRPGPSMDAIFSLSEVFGRILPFRSSTGAQGGNNGLTGPGNPPAPPPCPPHRRGTGALDECF